MTIVGCIRDKYHQAEICKCRENTEIVVDTGIDSVILKGELLASCLGRPRKMCDCVIFREDKKAAIVELKSKEGIHWSDLKEKFTNTGEEFCFIVKSLELPNFESLSLVLIKKRYKTMEYRILRDGRITIAGVKHKIHAKNDKTCLSAIVAASSGKGRKYSARHKYLEC